MSEAGAVASTMPAPEELSGKASKRSTMSKVFGDVQAAEPLAPIEPYPIGKFTGFLCRKPRIAMASIFLFVIIIAGIGQTFGGGDFGWVGTDFTSKIVLGMFGTRSAMYMYSGEDATFGWYDDDDISIADSAKQTVETYPNAQIIFHSKKGDVLSAKNLQSIREFQRSITKITKYEKYCLRGDSHGKDCMIPYSPSGIATWTSQTFADDDSSCNCATEFDVPCANCDSDCSADFYLPGCMADPMAPLPTSEWGKTAEPPFNAMCKQGTSDNADTSTCYYMLYQTRLNVMGTNWDCSNLEASWTRILVPFGLPIGNNDDDTEEMEDTIFSWGSNVFLPAFFELKAELEMDNSDLKVFFWGDQSWLIDYYLNRDVGFVMTAFILVFFVLWAQTESAFLAACGIFEIIISYPLGTFVWHVILQEPYVTYLNYNALFIILGIGADDIFVLVDAFKQASLQPEHISGSLETRFAWAYNRAASAMLATSLTTCAAFAACASSVIWDVAGFGIVAAVCIACDYLLVISWLAAAIIVQERYLKDVMVWCTPANLCGKLCAYCRKCCACCCKCCGFCCTPPEEAEGGTDEAGAEGGATAPKARDIEIFLGGRFADFVINNARKLIAFWSFMFVLSAVLCGLFLRPATENTEFFEKSHFFPVSRDASADKFGAAEGETTAYITGTLGFGLKPNDPFDLHDAHAVEAVNGDFDDTKANYKSGFDLANYQEAFSTACSEFSASLESSGIYDSSKYYCWIDEFKEWAEDKGYGFPVSTSKFRDYAVEWKSASVDEDSSYLFAVDQYEYQGNGDYSGLTGFLYNDNRVYYSFMSVNLTWTWSDLQRQKMSFPDMWDVYHDMNKATKAAEDASGLSGGVHSTGFYDWMVASKVFLESAFWNAGVALLIAFVVILFMTLNYKLTGLVFVGLFYVLAMVCLLMTISGWVIGIIEAIGVSVATGMAVDYVLHLSHSFNHQPAGPAPERVRGALQEMGISILSGCLTTWIACIALYCCDFLWFRLFGCFVTMVIWSSFFITMTGVTAILSLYGPESIEDGEVILPEWTGIKRYTAEEAVTVRGEVTENDL
jgi:hypothetical protein